MCPFTKLGLERRENQVSSTPFYRIVGKSRRPALRDLQRVPDLPHLAARPGRPQLSSEPQCWPRPAASPTKPTPHWSVGCLLPWERRRGRAEPSAVRRQSAHPHAHAWPQWPPCTVTEDPLICSPPEKRPVSKVWSALATGRTAFRGSVEQRPESGCPESGTLEVS